MSYQEVLLGLLPPVSYARSGERVRRQAQIDARVLDGVARSAEAVAAACLPDTSGALLADWERVLGLEAANVGKPYAARLSAVLLKINAVGGLSIPYFIQLAQSAGYTITIDYVSVGGECGGEHANGVALSRGSKLRGRAVERIWRQRD